MPLHDRKASDKLNVFFKLQFVALFWQVLYHSSTFDFDSVIPGYSLFIVLHRNIWLLI